MQRLIPIIATAWLLLAGCNRAHMSASDALARAEQQLAEERAVRQAVEARLREQESRTVRWQLIAFLEFGAVWAALITGAVLGSRARHDARREQPLLPL